MPPPPLIELRAVDRYFGKVVALRDVSFTVWPGEVHCLLGDNGAGKSTLIKILSGVHPPSRGEILVDGTVVSFRSPKDALDLGIATVYQDIALVRSMSIMRNIFAGREPRAALEFLKMREMRKTTMEILDSYVRIAGITSPDLPVEDLSGGQAQAVAIARAVHFKRDILLLDEPTSALSVRETEKVLAIMRDCAESGVSCVFVTHNLYHAFQVCDRFVVMAHGSTVKSVAKEDTSLNELTDLIMTH